MIFAAPRVNDDDDNWVQFRGFSPGISVHKYFQIGKGKVNYLVSEFYAAAPYPTELTHNLNVFFAVRPYFLDAADFSGIALECGVAYRMKTYRIEEFRLKD